MLLDWFGRAHDSPNPDPPLPCDRPDQLPSKGWECFKVLKLGEKAVHAPREAVLD